MNYYTKGLNGTMFAAQEAAYTLLDDGLTIAQEAKAILTVASEVAIATWDYYDGNKRVANGVRYCRNGAIIAIELGKLLITVLYFMGRAGVILAQELISAYVEGSLDPMQELVDQAQALNMGYEEPAEEFGESLEDEEVIMSLPDDHYEGYCYKPVLALPPASAPKRRGRQKSKYTVATAIAVPSRVALYL